MLRSRSKQSSEDQQLTQKVLKENMRTVLARLRGDESTTVVESSISEDIIMHRETVPQVVPESVSAALDKNLHTSAVATAVLEMNLPKLSTNTSLVSQPNLKRSAGSEDGTDQVEQPRVKIKKNRCGSCRTKLGLVPFHCRCGVHFCGKCRNPDDHDCTFDYKNA